MDARRGIPVWVQAYVRHLRHARRRASAMVGLAVTAACLEVVGLIAIGYMLNHDGQRDAMLVGAIVVGVSLAIAGLARGWSDLVGAHLQVDMEENLRREMTATILESDWQDFVGVVGHELQSAILAEAPQVASNVGAFLRGVAGLGSAAVVFAAAIWVSPVAAALSGVAGIGIAVLANRSMRHLGEAQHELAVGTVTMTRQTGILVTGLRSLRLSPVIQPWEGELRSSYARHASARSRDLGIPVRARVIGDVSGGILVAVVLAAAALSTGSAVSGMVAMALILRVVPRVQGGQQALSGARHGFRWIERWNDRIAALTPLTSSPADRAEGTGGDPVPALEIRGLGFSYRRHSEPVFEDLDLTLMPGEWIGVVGPSGEGKSTLIDLMGGVLVPARGSIRVGGTLTTEMDPDMLHARLAIVPQDVHLVGSTVREVLTWGGLVKKPDRIDEVVAALGIDAMFRYAGVGIDDPLDEEGRDISGGMRARLALGRALLSGPDVLVLDETTSRMPVSTENEIFEGIRGLVPRAAVICVTHRPPSDGRVDMYTLRKGHLVGVRADA